MKGTGHPLGGPSRADRRGSRRPRRARAVVLVTADLSRCVAAIRERIVRALDAVHDQELDLAAAALEAAWDELNAAAERAEQVEGEAARLLGVVARIEAALAQLRGSQVADARRPA